MTNDNLFPDRDWITKTTKIQAWSLNGRIITLLRADYELGAVTYGIREPDDRFLEGDGLEFWTEAEARCALPYLFAYWKQIPNWELQAILMVEDYTKLSDEDLRNKYNREIRYHDGLIDSADMGDERIYFSGKRIDAMREELKRRGLQ